MSSKITGPETNILWLGLLFHRPDESATAQRTSMRKANVSVVRPGVE